MANRSERHSLYVRTCSGEVMLYRRQKSESLMSSLQFGLGSKGKRHGYLANDGEKRGVSKRDAGNAAWMAIIDMLRKIARKIQYQTQATRRD